MRDERPMNELCETTDFFEAGKIYALVMTGECPEFWCKAVLTHPDTRVLYALGFIRLAPTERWMRWPTEYTLLDWRIGWEERRSDL